jgi:superfamily II DNA or RNA helicase
MIGYVAYLQSKSRVNTPSGFAPSRPIHELLFPFQKELVRIALAAGKFAIFSDCGTGKTLMQLEWAKHVSDKELKPVLILAPLAVAEQTCREADKLSLTVHHVAAQADVQRPYGIYITNYEKLHHFEPNKFCGIVLDESSILKNFMGATRNAIIEAFARTPYKLACTATPSPNDFMELGNHAEFLNVMRRAEMLSMFFVHDGGETQKWRIKKHAQKDFWAWVASWSIMLRKPSDLGFEQDGYDLPPLTIKQVCVDAQNTGDMLFAMPASSLSERLQARKVTITERIQAVADIANASEEQYLVFCNLNKESEGVTALINGAVEVTGSDTDEDKVARMLAFIDKSARVLVSKSVLCGFGMNFQNCRNVIFLGLSDSFESYYQAVRRVYRFGQHRPVNVWIVTANTEGAVVENIKRKQADAERMAEEMASQMAVNINLRRQNDNN